MPQTNIAIQSAQQELDALANTIRIADLGVARAVANMVEHALTAGDALIQAKAKAGHGNWLRYLKEQCDLSEDKAERYMRVARDRDVVEANSAHVRNLSLAQVLRLIDAEKRKSQPQAPGGPKAPKTAKIVKAPDRLNSLAWSDASPTERQAFLDKVGRAALLAIIPPAWDVVGEVLRTVSDETLFAEVARRKRGRRNSREAFVRGRVGKHDGPTLEVEATPIETRPSTEASRASAREPPRGPSPPQGWVTGRR